MPYTAITVIFPRTISDLKIKGLRYVRMRLRQPGLVALSLVFSQK